MNSCQEEGRRKLSKQQLKVRELSKGEGHYVFANESWLRRLYATLADPDLQIVAAFSLIGLLVMLILIFRFPDVVAAVAEYNQF